MSYIIHSHFPIWQLEKLRPVGDVWGSLYVVFFVRFWCVKKDMFVEGCQKKLVGEIVLKAYIHTLIFQFGKGKGGSKLI